MGIITILLDIYIFLIVSVLPPLTPNDPGEVSHSGLLHIEKGTPDAVKDMDSMLGRVLNRSKFDSCFAAVGVIRKVWILLIALVLRRRWRQRPIA